MAAPAVPAFLIATSVPGQCVSDAVLLGSTSRDAGSVEGFMLSPGSGSETAFPDASDGTCASNGGGWPVRRTAL